MPKFDADDPELEKLMADLSGGVEELSGLAAGASGAEEAADGFIERMLRSVETLVGAGMRRLAPEEWAEMERMEQKAREFERREQEMAQYYRDHPEERAKVWAARAKAPAIFMDHASRGRGGLSKLSGCPDLPDGVAVPLNPEGREMEFLAQIACAELPRPHPLPDRGMLYFFCDTDTLSAWPVADPAAYCRVLYTEEEPARRSGDGPDVAFKPGWSYASGPYQPGIDEGEWHLTPHWLLGFPGWDEEEIIADDRSGGDWRLLLRLASDDEFGWLWSDCGICVWYIRDGDLARGDFSGVRMRWVSS